VSSLKGKPVLILSASPGAFGGVRAQAHLRAALASTLPHVFPWPEIVVTQAKAKLVDGDLVDDATRDFVAKALAAFHDYAGRWQ
jgi:chromate reductase